MWIFQTSLASAAKQFIQDNGWFEVLDIENLGTAFLDKFDSEIYYCLNPNEFVFK
ncbi:MAG TPA: hypothetical protein GX731_01970 [Clostridiales bacterium]|nr:hypothetical protein [Clostridiales bacterium]